MASLSQFDEETAREMRRRRVRRALAKYIFLRSRSYSAVVGENGMVFIIDTEGALAKLETIECKILLSSVLGFSIPEIAKIVHRGHSTVERHLPQVHEKAAHALVDRGVIREEAYGL